MSTNHHDPIANNAAATAANINFPLGQLDAAIPDIDVTIDGTPADNEVLAYDTGGGDFTNQTAAEAGLATATHTQQLEDGGTEADLSATGPGFLKQASSGAAVTIANPDASEVTYTPTTLTDWDGDADPGDADDALDQLAERVDDTEIATGTRMIELIIDGGGIEIATGEKGHLVVPFTATITEAWALADQSGSIVVDIWKDTYANFPPDNADSITASAPITISTAVKSKDTTLTGWTTAITADDILAFNVDSVTDIERVTIILKVTA